MAKKSPIAPNTQEHREDAPSAWPEVQDRLADSSNLALLLIDGHQPPAVVVSNNNSICRAFQSSPEHVKLCDAYCGVAHAEATKANGAIKYKCHAGLQCFAKPVQVGSKRNLAVIGGRAFVSTADYRQLMERFRDGDLQKLAANETFSNVIFSDAQHLDDLAERVDSAARRLQSAASNGSGGSKTTASVPSKAKAQAEAPAPPPPPKPDLEQEVRRLRSELEYRAQITGSLQHLLERISCADPAKTYNSIVSNVKEMLRSDRASLLMLNESSNELVLKAASGFATDTANVGPLRVGEGVSGKVIDTGKPLVVTDLRLAGLTPASPARKYKTNSFISYPITIGGRKVGVLNVTDKSGGGSFSDVDLTLLDLIGPQVALALERAEWQERATEFQLMSITDPLTALTNRRYLEERLTEELNRSRRYDYAVSFLMIDIDDFKGYNDRNGHQAGDLALQITAHCLKGGLRSADVASRYGGEEFCILLPQTGIAEAGAIAERIRQRVRTADFPHGKTQPLGRVTVSIGVSTFSSLVNTSENIIAAADRALYKAKNMGKDRVVFYGDDGVTGRSNE
ncbi:MAG TPA: diguanylate cyclase [Pyrinomonadaceae bacterium]|nr:diguanylate cyclase [Pyrinomonadaceae bacterium]